MFKSIKHQETIENNRFVFEVDNEGTPSLTISPLTTEIEKDQESFVPLKFVKSKSHLKEFKIKSSHRRYNTPNQCGRLSPLKKCENISNSQKSFDNEYDSEDDDELDVCDLEILEILRGSDSESDDYQNNIINFDVDRDGRCCSLDLQRSYGPEIFFDL